MATKMKKSVKKTVSVRGLIKGEFTAKGGPGTILTLRQLYDGIARKIPAEEGVASYGRVKGRSIDDATPLREKIAEGRKRLIYRCLSDMKLEENGEVEVVGDEAQRDWDKQYRSLKAFAQPSPIAKRVAVTAAPAKKRIKKKKSKSKRGGRQGQLNLVGNHYGRGRRDTSQAASSISRPGPTEWQKAAPRRRRTPGAVRQTTTPLEESNDGDQDEEAFHHHECPRSRGRRERHQLVRDGHGGPGHRRDAVAEVREHAARPA